jgi:hypothetical protein
VGEGSDGVGEYVAALFHPLDLNAVVASDRISVIEQENAGGRVHQPKALAGPERLPAATQALKSLSNAMEKALRERMSRPDLASAAARSWASCTHYSSNALLNGLSV